MRIPYFSIYDKKSLHYTPIWQAQTFGAAERAFNTAVNSDSNDYSKYPEDFDLFHVGNFDDETGIFEPCTPQYIVSAIQLLKS